MVRVVRSNLPWRGVHTIADTNLGKSQVILFVAAIVLTTGLWWFYSRTRFGLASSAAAENQEATSASAGRQIHRRCQLAAGVALAGLAAIFLAPTASLGPDMTLFVVPALAAALIGRFSSFWLTLGSALAIGVAESEMANYVSEPGGPRPLRSSSSSPSLVDARPTASATRRGNRPLAAGEWAQDNSPAATCRRQPRRGRADLVDAVGWVDAMASTFTYAVVLLSLTVLTGFTGQLSLAQYTMAGMGAYIAGRPGRELRSRLRTCDAHRRVRGDTARRPRRVAGTAHPRCEPRCRHARSRTHARAVDPLQRRPHGWRGWHAESANCACSASTSGHCATPSDTRLLGLVCLLLTGLMVSNLRRGRSGRRLLAVRANERAAASLGINVFGAKLYAFGLASGIAALGGILIAFRNQRIVYTNFGLFDSIFATVQGVIGGIGFVLGVGVRRGGGARSNHP